MDEAYICEDCGGKVVWDEYIKVWACENCGTIYDSASEYGLSEYDESYDEMYREARRELENDPNYIPPGCAACGGPYPKCKTSCKIFDD